MRSNYKRIGQFVQQVNNRNNDLVVTDLKGISINKLFMPSVANINGTDLSTYKVVQKKQFAYNPMHVGRDEVLPIGMLEADQPVIVSPAYVVFEIVDPEALLPEYLMMWCRRPEFDRNAWFTTDSSVRGGFNWDDFCDMTLPVPHPDKQREIVSEYSTIVERIKLNEQLIQKLEETAQALYKQWFVDFEFPISKEYAKSIGKPEFEGKSYRSNGGTLISDDTDSSPFPYNWKHGSLGGVARQFSGYPFNGNEYSLENGITVLRGENVTEQKLRWDTHKMWDIEIPVRAKNCFLRENDIVIGMDGSKVGKNWAMISGYDLPMLLAQRVACIRANNKTWQIYLYFSLFIRDFSGYVTQVHTGTSVPHISGDQICEFPILIPDEFLIKRFNNLAHPLISKILLITKVSSTLKKAEDIVLSRISIQD